MGRREGARVFWIFFVGFKRHKGGGGVRSIIRSFASCYTQCLQKKKMKKVYCLTERWRSEAEAFFYCPTVTSTDAASQMRSRRWRFLWALIGVPTFDWCVVTYLKKALFFSMAIIQTFWSRSMLIPPKFIDTGCVWMCKTINWTSSMPCVGALYQSWRLC